MTLFNRRSLMTASAAGVASATVPMHARSEARDDAQASSEVQHRPFHRSKLGSADLTIVSDGKIAFEPTMFWPEVPEERLQGFLSDLYLPTDELVLQVNAMVIDLNGRRVLIDAGNGDGKFQPTAGGLAENLQSAGIDPATIDTVIFTHLHPDHLWGVTDAENDTLVFPEAEYVAVEAEYAFWSDPELADRVPDEWRRQIARTTLAHLTRIEDRLRTVATSAEAVPGITFVPTHGHTVGHASIMLENEGESLISAGDVITNPVVSFERPEWGMAFDTDMEQGTATRLDFLDMAAADRLRVFAYHLPWPGFGHVARAREAYRWIPEQWAG